MIVHDLIQGTPEWMAFRAQHFSASNAPVMLGISPYKTRTQLLDEYKTGITQEVDEATQRRFADGHRFEALARPLAEKIIGKKLYPVIGSEGKLSASFDGLTADDTICFEHKTLNNDLRACANNDEFVSIPELYRAQMEQQLMLSGAERCLFGATAWDDDDKLIEAVWGWYESDHEMRQRLMQGWTQFSIDLETHQPKVIAERPQAQVSIELPTLFVHAHGAITDSNMEEFGRALTAKLAEVRAIKLETDQDFSNAKESAKLFRDQAKKLKLAKEAMLAQTVSIGEASRMIDAWAEDLNKTALQLEKDVEREDLAKKRAMCNEAALEFTAHIEALEAETRPIQLNLPRPDFAQAIKSKRNYASMHDAIQTMLSQAKSQADAVAKDYRAKLAWCKEHAAGQSALFPDLQQIITKPFDDFTLTITSRIEKAKADEAARLEEQRQRMEAEATAKAEREAAAKLAEETARIRAEEQAKARAKVEAEQNAKQVSVAAGRQEGVAQEAPALSKEPAGAAAMPGGSSATGTKGIVLTDRAAQPASRPSDDEIIETLSLHFRVHESKVIEWLLDVDLHAASERMAKEFA